MISVEEAQERVLAEVGLLGTEQVAFVEAIGRVLREDVRASADLPQADNTAMDGYAVRAEDIANPPVRLRVIEDLPAGTVATTRVDPGTAIRIMTGALIPDGADTVAHVEITDAGSDFVTVKESLKRGTNLRRRGEDMRAGEVVLHDGTPAHGGPGVPRARPAMTDTSIARALFIDETSYHRRPRRTRRLGYCILHPVFSVLGRGDAGRLRVQDLPGRPNHDGKVGLRPAGAPGVRV